MSYEGNAAPAYGTASGYPVGQPRPLYPSGTSELVTSAGVVQRWPAGHRIRLMLAASDAAYAGNTAVLPVTVTTGPADPGVLRLPVVGDPPATTG